MLGQGCEKSEEVPVNSRELLRCSSTQPFAKAFYCRVRLRPNVAMGRPARLSQVRIQRVPAHAPTPTETDRDQKNEGTRGGGRDTDKERDRDREGERSNRGRVALCGQRPQYHPYATLSAQLLTFGAYSGAPLSSSSSSGVMGRTRPSLPTKFELPLVPAEPAGPILAPPMTRCSANSTSTRLFSAAVRCDMTSQLPTAPHAVTKIVL